MAGHSHWAGIKHKKEITDKKRGKEFSKLLKLVSAAAQTEPDPNFNPRLRTAVEKARAAGVTGDKIEAAIKRAGEVKENLEELVFEAYGPGGVAIMIEALSNNRNRMVQEVKKILSDHEGKWAEIGSVTWAFDLPAGGHNERKAKFPQALSEEDAKKLDVLVDALEDHDDVQKVYTNAE